MGPTNAGSWEQCMWGYMDTKGIIEKLKQSFIKLSKCPNENYVLSKWICQESLLEDTIGFLWKILSDLYLRAKYFYIKVYVWKE